MGEDYTGEHRQNLLIDRQITLQAFIRTNDEVPRAIIACNTPQ